MDKTSYKKLGCVGGLVFVPTAADRKRLHPCRVFPGVGAWVSAGSPDNSVVYDHAGALVDHNFPLLDAVLFNGAYVRSSMQQPTAARIAMHPLETPAPKKFDRPGLSVLSENNVQMVDPKAVSVATGRMSRGVGHRVAKDKDAPK